MQCFLSTRGHLKFNALLTLHIFSYLTTIWSIHDIGHSHTNSGIFIGCATDDQYNDVSFSLLWTPPFVFKWAERLTCVYLTMTIILFKKDNTRIALNSKRLCYSYNKSQRDALLLCWLSASSLAVNITSMTNAYCCEYSIKTPDDGQ